MEWVLLSFIELNRLIVFRIVKTNMFLLIYVLKQEKRRIQEDIAKKRRTIEEEKLKLQYLKVYSVLQFHIVVWLIWGSVVLGLDLSKDYNREISVVQIEKSPAGTVAHGWPEQSEWAGGRSHEGTGSRRAAAGPALATTNLQVLQTIGLLQFLGVYFCYFVWVHVWSSALTQLNSVWCI